MSSTAPGTGDHRLWLNAGGSAGHGGVWALDVHEGVIDDEFKGRVWEPSIAGADDARQKAKAERLADRAADERKRLLDALAAFPQGETKSVLRDHAGVKSAVATRILTALVHEGSAREVEITKGNNRVFEGFQLTDSIAVIESQSDHSDRSRTDLGQVAGPHAFA